MADQETGLLSPWLRRRRIQEVRRHLAGRVLDFGCGTGALAAMCAPSDYVGYDIDPESVALARQFYPQHSFETTLLNDRQFDTIALLAVIEHVAEPVAILAQLKEMLAPDGRIVMTTPHPAGRVLYALGAHIGLFGIGAHEQHERYFGNDAMKASASAAGMVIDAQKVFLGGLNQLFIARVAERLIA